MTAVIIAPALELCRVERRGIVQVEAVDAAARCPSCGTDFLADACAGISITSLPAELHHLEYYLREVQTTFIERQRVRGYEPFDLDLRLHGPFPSYDFVKHLTDINSSAFSDANRRDRNGEQHPELVLPVVFERRENGFRDYVFKGWFLKQEQLTEVIVNDD